MSASEWKDVTNWRRDDKDRSVPRTVEMQVAWVCVCVTRHISTPGVWYLHCPDLGMGHRKLQALDLEKAKQEALSLVYVRVSEVMRALDEVTP